MLFVCSAPYKSALETNLQTQSNFVMKCDMRNLSRPQASSADGERGPLFPPLHVNDTGKAGIRAPPRNKMALFEQFTVPYNRGLPLSKGVSAEAASQQHGTNDFIKTYEHYATTSTVELNNVVGEIGKSSYGSSIGSLSTCSAVVNVDEPQRSQEQETEDDTCSLFEPKLWIVPRKGQSRFEKVSDAYLQKYKVAEGVFLFPHVDEKGEACGQAAGLAIKGFHKWDKGIMRGGNPIPEDANCKGQSCQEAITSLKGRSYPEATLNVMEIADALNAVEPTARLQLKSSTGECASRSALNALEQPVASYQSNVPPVVAIIKPKDVIHVVGQQLFWKARKALLRQQEVFSNQVFELHKLIEVQKFLAKIPSTLMDERLLSGMALDKVGLDFYPVKVKVNSRKQEKSIKATQQLPASQRCEGPVHESRPPQKFLSCEKREGEVVGIESSTKRRSQHSYSSQAVTNAPFIQAHQFSSSNKDSAWGYPMGSLNRPFLYPPAASHFPSGSGYGGAYVVGANQPMAPYTFPCYTPSHEQQPLMFCHANQWSPLMYHNPFLASTANDWFGMNHAGQVPLASGSEKPGPTTSVPSINMKAEASSPSVQHAGVPLSRRHQFGLSSGTKLVAAKSLGSVATASVSAPPSALSGKPAANPGRGSKFIPEVWGAFGGEAIGQRGLSKDTKEEAQLPHCSREERLDSDRSHALKLFPLQPLNGFGGASEGQAQEGGHGRVIKAIPRSALAASESTAGILLSIQRERQQ